MNSELCQYFNNQVFNCSGIGFETAVKPLGQRQNDVDAKPRIYEILQITNAVFGPSAYSIPASSAAKPNDARAAQTELIYRAHANSRHKRHIRPLPDTLGNLLDAQVEQYARCSKRATRVNKIIKHHQLDCLGKNGLTLLMSAARDGCLDQVKLLLAAGADINIKEPQKKRTALIFAVKKQQTEVVACLLAHYKTLGKPESVRYADGDNMNAIMYATKNGNQEMASTLFIAGDYANYMIKRQDVVNAIQSSLSKSAGLCAGAVDAAGDDGDDGGVTDQRQKTIVSARDDITGQADKLMAAEHDDDIPMIDHALARNVGINAVDREGKTGLIRAAERGSLQIVMALLERGADITLADEHHKTALDYATEQGHTPIIALLAQHNSIGSSARGQADMHENTLIGFGKKILQALSEGISQFFVEDY